MVHDTYIISSSLVFANAHYVCIRVQNSLYDKWCYHYDGGLEIIWIISVFY